MVQIKKYAVITIILAIVSMIMLGISHLALTDIYHGQEDLSYEWAFLRISALIFIVFIISTIFTLQKVLKLTGEIKY
ncbi:MAG: hypothetical protein GY729_07130 [Desulfobacteraceae bacterium]|nr:hypothetical protein [Desulfobacteraceae bacterium]